MTESQAARYPHPGTKIRFTQHHELTHEVRGEFATITHIDYDSVYFKMDNPNLHYKHFSLESFNDPHVTEIISFPETGMEDTRAWLEAVAS